MTSPKCAIVITCIVFLSSEWDDFFAESPQPPPIPSVVPLQASKHIRSVRTSFEQRKEDKLDSGRIKQELLAWECGGKRCGMCLSALSCNSAMVDFAVEHICTLRINTFSHKQHSVSTHIKHLLTTCLHAQITICV